MSRPKARLQPAVDCLESVCDLVFGVLVEVSVDVHRDADTGMAKVLGREANHAYVAVEGNRAAIDVLTQAVTRDWTDQPAVARRNQLNQPRQLVL